MRIVYIQHTPTYVDTSENSANMLKEITFYVIYQILLKWKFTAQFKESRRHYLSQKFGYD